MRPPALARVKSSKKRACALLVEARLIFSYLLIVFNSAAQILRHPPISMRLSETVVRLIVISDVSSYNAFSINSNYNDYTCICQLLGEIPVLIVFASISLVVSSVMTAIITYVSVIERTKEIGVLRACGARKRDVGRLFEAECIITGGVAGLVGVGVSYILCVPINLILDNLYPGNGLNSIANLNPLHALALLLLSTALAFLSGFIPSRIAAKKDPVICLRTE